VIALPVGTGRYEGADSDIPRTGTVDQPWPAATQAGLCVLIFILEPD